MTDRDPQREPQRDDLGGGQSPPRLLDLFCGAGGAAMGYHRAGFDVVGVDAVWQANYPFEFVLGDALQFMDGGWWLSPGEGAPFDAIHASPPCQEYSSAGKANKVTLGKVYADLYEPVRDMLEATGLPWAIENVTAAPSRSGVLLCGSMFGLPIQRHRTFETSELLLSPFVCNHSPDAITITGHSPQQWLGGSRKTVPRDVYEAAMGIDWMLVRELVQAVPPVYTEFVGAHLMEQVTAVAA
jgi:DNA (cytosine-5)-methyltransferase 1